MLRIETSGSQGNFLPWMLTTERTKLLTLEENAFGFENLHSGILIKKNYEAVFEWMRIFLNFLHKLVTGWSLPVWTAMRREVAVDCGRRNLRLLKKKFLTSFVMFLISFPLERKSISFWDHKFVNRKTSQGTCNWKS